MRGSGCRDAQPGYGCGRDVVCDNVKRVEPKTRRVFHRTERIQQFQVSKHDVSLITQEITLQDRTQALILKSFANRKPHLPTRPNVKRIQAVVVSEWFGRVKLAQKLLVASHHLAAARKQIARVQKNSKPLREDIG